MKLDRMLGITLELLSKQRVTAAELAERFEVSIRTVYRDIELINQAGIPVASYTGADGGFELMNGFFLAKQHFSVDDFSVLYNLLQGLDGAMGGKAAALMSKLSSLQPALLKGGSRHQLIFDMSSSEAEKAVIHPLYDAVRERRVVSFSYTSASGTATSRQAEPIALYWERGAWYLDAYCRLRHAKRMFRISRLSELESLEERFPPRDMGQLPAEEEAQGMQVHLRFGLEAQPRVWEQFGSECALEDGCINVRTVFYSQAYAVSVVLSYGTQVTVVSPEELKRDVAQTAKQIQLLYEGEEQQT